MYRYTKEDKAIIAGGRKANKDKRAEKRLYALELRAAGKSVTEVASATGFHAAYISQLTAKYQRGGIEAISGNHYGGNRRNMVPEEAALLEPFREKAEKGQIVDVSEIKSSYEQAVGHIIGGSQIYYVLHRNGWRKVVPRSKHPKKASEEVIAASKKINTQIAELKKVFHNEKKIRLMFQDEAGFGRINKPRYCWCRKGTRPVVPCHHIREYRYAYGAVEPHSGDGFFLVLPYCNTDCMNLFLRELSKQYEEDIIFLCCDGAAWHKSRTLCVPENIVLFFRTCIHNRRTPSRRVFSRHTVSISLEIRQDSCGKFPCLAEKSLAHPASASCEYRFLFRPTRRR